MREVFHGWRRKFGVLTLLMACVFTGEWVRSYTVNDEIAVTWSGRLHAFLSSSGEFSLISWSNDEIPDSFEWEVKSDVSNGQVSHYMSLGMPRPKRHWFWWDEVREMTADKSGIWIIHYWSIVTPLTLLSAFLLLTKPRKSTPKKITESVPSEGA